MYVFIPPLPSLLLKLSNTTVRSLSKRFLVSQQSSFPNNKTNMAATALLNVLPPCQVIYSGRGHQHCYFLPATCRWRVRRRAGPSLNRLTARLSVLRPPASVFFSSSPFSSSPSASISLWVLSVVVHEQGRRDLVNILFSPAWRWRPK